jgi:hypothetical protein
VTGIRCVYGALFLLGTPAMVWSGSLLRLGRLVVAGTRPPSGVVDVAAARVPLALEVDGAYAASLAIGYLTQEDLDQLWDLKTLVVEAARARTIDPWVDDLWVAVRAALATPLEPNAFPLFAVRCQDCWKPGAGRKLPPLLVDVGTFDDAIRCPGCGEIPAHPLPDVKTRAPHPVGRCLGGAWGSPNRCQAHEGFELDETGLCVEGRAVMEKAVPLAAAMVDGTHHPHDEALVRAVVRAHESAQRALAEEQHQAISRSMEALVLGMKARGGPPSKDQILGNYEEHMGGFQTVLEEAFGSVDAFVNRMDQVVEGAGGLGPFIGKFVAGIFGAGASAEPTADEQAVLPPAPPEKRKRKARRRRARGGA